MTGETGAEFVLGRVLGPSSVVKKFLNDPVVSENLCSTNWCCVCWEMLAAKVSFVEEFVCISGYVFALVGAGVGKKLKGWTVYAFSCCGIVTFVESTNWEEDFSFSVLIYEIFFECCEKRKLFYNGEKIFSLAFSSKSGNSGAYREILIGLQLILSNRNYF